jgi:hypothetical protein
MPYLFAGEVSSSVALGGFFTASMSAAAGRMSPNFSAIRPSRSSSRAVWAVWVLRYSCMRRLKLRKDSFWFFRYS